MGKNCPIPPVLAATDCYQPRNAIRGKTTIRRNHLHSLHLSLCEDHPIKRILVLRRQFTSPQQRLCRKRKFHLSPPPHLLSPPVPGRVGQRQFSCTVF